MMATQSPIVSLAREVSGMLREAGGLARAEFCRSSGGVAKEQGDVVTSSDLEVNRFVIDRLTRMTPEYGIMSEEGPSEMPDTRWTWILDPLDGSKHYAQGLPLYGLSLALHEDGAPRLGVVYSPGDDDLFCGIPGTGAWRNGKPIQCKEAGDLLDMIVGVELPSRHRAGRIDGALSRLDALMRSCQRVRMFGVTSLGMCYCAAGGFGAYVNLGSSPNAIWDRAAGEAILMAAGGRVAAGRDYIAAAHERLMPRLVSVIESAQR